MAYKEITIDACSNEPLADAEVEQRTKIPSIKKTKTHPTSKIIKRLGGSAKPLTEKEIIKNLGVRKQIAVKSLRDLVKKKQVIKTGVGVRNNPFLYELEPGSVDKKENDVELTSLSDEICQEPQLNAPTPATTEIPSNKEAENV